MKWSIKNPNSPPDSNPILVFDDKKSALSKIQKYQSGRGHSLVEVYPLTRDPFLYRILKEGLMAGDLRRILLPQISIDEYVPEDPESTNVVIGFFVKGVPEAIIPFQDFIQHCVGVINTATSDSDTVPDTSVVYVEFQRDTLKMSDIRDMMAQISILTNLDPRDFTTMFPHTTSRFPYDLQIIDEYFQNRQREQEEAAVKAAMEQPEDAENDNNDEQRNESVMKRLQEMI